MKILLIDDDASVLKALERLLRSNGIEYESFNDPQTAIDWICEPPGDFKKKPDLVLTDLDLKGGYTGIALIKIAREGWGSNLPAVIMTGGFRTASEADCLKVTPDILHKPVSWSDLEKLLPKLDQTITTK